MSWWLVMLSNFSYACWSIVFFWRNVYSSPEPILLVIFSLVLGVPYIFLRLSLYQTYGLKIFSHILYVAFSFYWLFPLLWRFAAETIWKFWNKSPFSDWISEWLCLCNDFSSSVLYISLFTISSLLGFRILGKDYTGNISELDLCLDGLDGSEPWRAAHMVQTTNSHDLIMAGLCWPYFKSYILEQSLIHKK